MRATLLAPILPRVMEEGESKKAALILIGHYGNTATASSKQEWSFSNPHALEQLNYTPLGVPKCSQAKITKILILIIP